MVKVHLKTLSDDDRPVFLTGSFCDWQTELPAFRMTNLGAGGYEFTFPELVRPPFSYKYTKGDWSSVELDASGWDTPNREWIGRVATRSDTVPHFMTGGKAFDPWMSPGLKIWPEMTMKPLRRKRRVSILLPAGYGNTDERYPVLYFQDGQNIYGGGSVYGDWALDRKMAIRAQQGRRPFIGVVIDHGAERRRAEFNPYARHREGVKYLQWLTTELKPEIDRHFRTLPDRRNTGLCGSSLGGLISLYGVAHFPDIFGMGLIFSPSLWVSQQVYTDAATIRSGLGTKIYLYVGGKESAGTAAAVRKMNRVLREAGAAVALSEKPAATHSEAAWSAELPFALSYLLDESTV
ncbi:Predicted hydrolase of the alpha/beta superfamily [Siphonobacter aquaeclarae]|uniref:Predicted hydrolase of the alpha/beta superfamily n=1 Tax=Siphonobacter aquaeclarae TaxID=563176 RepID=A0A1G9U2Z9_9BACT|nr:Predicted hydrolase of the alpha/beta superfamily [Siphonobacter aquaeclarae]